MNGEEPALSTDGHTQEVACLNCGAALVGPHCHQCGQHAHVHRSIAAVGHDLLHGVLHWEGSFWHTLPLLAWQPGKLTRRYIEGERKKFVSPLTLFLFAIFMMFVIFGFIGGPFGDVGGPEGQEQYAAQAAAFDAQIKENAETLKTLPPGDPGRAKLVDQMHSEMSGRNGLAVIQGEPMPYPKVLGSEDAEGAEGFTADTGSPWLDGAIAAVAHKVETNPGLIAYKMKSNGYKFAWLLIPLSLPFVWLVTIGSNGARFYDHAVFTTYSLSFMVLLFVVLSLLGKIGVGSGLLLARAC